jgi:exonuclease III
MNDTLKLCSWNVRGFGDPNRTQIARNWAQRFYDTLDVMCYQELQANSHLVQLHLQTLGPEGQVFIVSSGSGRVGSAIVTARHIKVLDNGSRGDGTFTWVKVDSVKGPIFIGSVYAPAGRRARIRF